MARPRISGFQPCATFGCSGRTPTRETPGRGRGYSNCESCRAMRGTPLDPPVQVGEREIERVTIQEAKVGGGPETRRIKLYGPGKCVVCEGPTIPGRLYCSRRCRSKGMKGEGTVDLGGVVATAPQHARRLGLGRTTFMMRLRIGMSVSEALTTPLNEEMKRRLHGPG